MVDTVGVSQLKAHCLRLVEQVARKRRSILVTKRGKPVARLVPVGGARPDEALAQLRGTLIGGTRIEDFVTGVTWEATRR